MNNIQKGVIKGVWWTGLGEFTTRLLGFLNIIILAKFLEPRDFGLFAITIFIYNFIMMAGDLGLRSALIQRQDREEEVVQIVFWILAVLGLCYFILVFFLAGYIARFYNEKILSSAIKILSLAIFLWSLSGTHTALFQKRLEFKKLNLALVSSNLARVVLSIYLATRGLGIWALVWGIVLQTSLYSLIMWILLPWRPRLTFDKNVTGELFNFGMPITVFTVLTFIILNVDRAFIGKVLGASALGYYAIAFNLSNILALNISAVVQSVFFPAYAILQSDTVRLRDGFQKSLRYIVLIVFPLSLGVFILAREITIAIYGEKWLPIVPVLKVLCFFGLFRALNWFGGNIVMAKGEVKLMRNLAWRQILIMAVIIYPLSIKWGILGVAFAVTLAMGINTFWYFKRIGRLLDSSLNNMVNMINVPFISTFSMVAGIYILKQFFNITSILDLFLLTLGGGLIYFAFVLFLDRNIMKEARDIVTTLVKK